MCTLVLFSHFAFFILNIKKINRHTNNSHNPFTFSNATVLHAGFFLMCVWGAGVCVWFLCLQTHAGTCTHVHTCEGGKRTLAVLSSCPLPYYSLETGSPTQPGTSCFLARLAASMLQLSSCLYRGYRCTGSHIWLSTREVGTQWPHIQFHSFIMFPNFSSGFFFSP